MRHIALLLSMILICLLLPTKNSNAFSPGFIISDEEFTDETSMDQNMIYSFLKRKRSFLLDYKPQENIFASFVIYDAARQYNINPKILLTLLQKEQSLIEKSYPTQYSLDWAVGYGMCDSCTRETEGINIFKGFSNQIYQASKRLREYYDSPDRFHFREKNTYTIDGETVLIRNKATAALYNYTPHIHGNKNFSRIWERWFIRAIPNGSLVKTPDSPKIWLIHYGSRRPIKNMSVLQSRYDATKIITVNPYELENYEDGTEIKFYPFALLEDPKKNKYLLIDEDTIRPIESENVFRKLGYNPEELIPISWEDLQTFHSDEPITETTVYPQGVLIRDPETKGIYFVKDGYRYPLLAPELIKTNFKNVAILNGTRKEIDKFIKSEPIKFIDGTLIKAKGSSTVYNIDEGTRRPIKSGEVFKKKGYKWDTIVETTTNLVMIHPLGDIIDEPDEHRYNTNE